LIAAASLVSKLLMSSITFIALMMNAEGGTLKAEGGIFIEEKKRELCSSLSSPAY
jgi:hypothetical protein